MIRIQEIDIDGKKFNKLLKKMGNTQYSLNKQLIMDDMSKLSKKRDKVGSTRVGRSNLRNTIKYLERMHSLIGDNGEMAVEWEYINGSIKTYPIQFTNMDAYNTNTMDYLIRGDKSSVLVDYTYMMDMIAFQLSYRDMGITVEQIEDILGNLGIIAVYDAEIILKHIPKFTYYRSKALKINKCNFINDDSGEGVLFFPCDKAKIIGETYECMLNTAYNEAMKRLTYYILKEVNANTIIRDLVLLGCVSDRAIHYIIEELTPDILNTISQSVLIRIFGRKFEFKPTVRIY